MVLRIAKKGSQKGGEFWGGGANYPKCREAVQA